MKTKKVAMAPRGVRFSNKQWRFLEHMAQEANRKDLDANATPSDVVRHAVDLLMEDYDSKSQQPKAS